VPDHVLDKLPDNFTVLHHVEAPVVVGDFFGGFSFDFETGTVNPATGSDMNVSSYFDQFGQPAVVISGGFFNRIDDVEIADYRTIEITGYLGGAGWGIDDNDTMLVQSSYPDANDYAAGNFVISDGKISFDWVQIV
jgi:hypothetical protein